MLKQPVVLPVLQRFPLNYMLQIKNPPPSSSLSEYEQIVCQKKELISPNIFGKISIRVTVHESIIRDQIGPFYAKDMHSVAYIL